MFSGDESPEIEQKRPLKLRPKEPFRGQSLQEFIRLTAPLLSGAIGVALIVISIFVLEDNDPDKAVLQRYGEYFIIGAGSSQIPSKH